MTSFKRWSGTGAIVLVALALIACPSTFDVPATVAKEIGDLSFGVGAGASKITLTGYFNVTEPEYSATSSDTAVATASVTGAELTVTPVGAGTANVTVTAKGEEGSVSQTLSVMVASPPVAPATPAPQLLATMPSPISFATMDADAITHALATFFSGAATYTAVSTDMTVATATVADGALTIAPVGVGSSIVVVTAINSGGTLSQSVVVVVGQPLVPPPVPVNIVGTFASQDFTYDDTADRMFTLSAYFSGATTYEVTSTAMAVATAAEAAGVLTVMPVGAGSADISVTASNADDRTPALTQTFLVTVEEAPKPPALRMGKSFMDLRMSAMSGDNLEPFTLNEYFHDPDGFALLTYSTTTSDAKTVAVYATPPPAVTAADTDTSTPSVDVTIEARAAGTATITIVATDASGMSNTQTFMVTVFENNAAPISTSTDLPEGLTMLTGADRLHSVGAKSMTTVKVDLNAHFTDEDETATGTDTLTFKATSSDMKVATVILTPTGNAALPREHNVMVVAVGPGTPGTPVVITLIATDSFGREAMKTFSVQVNNRPDAQGAQATPLKLADYKGYMRMAIGDKPDKIELDSDTTGYFSDKDVNDMLTCDFLTSQHNVAKTMRTAVVMVANNMLEVTAQKIGTMTIDVWCSDGLEDSDKVTVTVEVDRGA
jgi:hypothetical protein